MWCVNGRSWQIATVSDLGLSHLFPAIQSDVHDIAPPDPRQMSRNIRLRRERDEAHNLQHLHFSSTFPSHPSPALYPTESAPEYTASHDTCLNIHTASAEQEILFVMIYALYFDTDITIYLRVIYSGTSAARPSHQSIFNQSAPDDGGENHKGELLFYRASREKHSIVVSHWYKARV